jgi:hypothetical protein
MKKNINKKPAKKINDEILDEEIKQTTPCNKLVVRIRLAIGAEATTRTFITEIEPMGLTPELKAKEEQKALSLSMRKYTSIVHLGGVFTVVSSFVGIANL